MTNADALHLQLEALARRAAEGEGVLLDWLELQRRGSSWVVRVFIDREDGGVSLDDCERVSQRLSLLLDVEDPIESSFTLEVSTPGLDRPLRRETDYERFVGRLARIRTKEPIGGRRRFLGRIGGVERGAVKIHSAEGEAFQIPFGSIDKARLEVEFPPSREGKRP